MPSWRQNDEAQAPPACTTVRVCTVPASVTTPLTRPPCSSSPRTAHCCTTVPPSLTMAAAAAGAALPGSAVPSVGENTPPFHACPVALPRALASAALSMCVTTPAVLAKSRQRAQRSSSASSLLR